MAELGQTRDPKVLVPGNPDAIEENARVLKSRAAEAIHAGEGLRAIDTGSWSGQAAAKFHDKFSYEPAKWLQAGDSLEAAGVALARYAESLRWAQGQASEAIRLWDQGQAATQAAKAQHDATVAQARAQTQANAAHGNPAVEQVAPFSDPGETNRQAARETLLRARQQLTEAGDHAAEVISDEAGGAPQQSDWLDEALRFIGESDIVQFGAGLWDSVSGFGQTLWNLLPIKAIWDPDGYADGLVTMAQHAWHNVTHPVDFLKSAVAWDEWADHPGRATGQIIGGIALGGLAGKALGVLGKAGKGEGKAPRTPEPPSVRASIGDYFNNRATPKASELEQYAVHQGWTKQQTPNGPAKYVDDKGIVRMTLKQGSSRAPGSENPHVELRNADGVRIDPSGSPVNRKSLGNHTPIVWDH